MWTPPDSSASVLPEFDGAEVLAAVLELLPAFAALPAFRLPALNLQASAAQTSRPSASRPGWSLIEGVLLSLLWLIAARVRVRRKSGAQRGCARRRRVRPRASPE